MTPKNGTTALLKDADKLNVIRINVLVISERNHYIFNTIYTNKALFIAHFIPRSSFFFPVSQHEYVRLNFWWTFMSLCGWSIMDPHTTETGVQPPRCCWGSSASINICKAIKKRMINHFYRWCWKRKWLSWDSCGQMPWRNYLSPVGGSRSKQI